MKFAKNIAKQGYLMNISFFLKNDFFGACTQEVPCFTNTLSVAKIYISLIFWLILTKHVQIWRLLVRHQKCIFHREGEVLMHFLTCKFARVPLFYDVLLTACFHEYPCLTGTSRVPLFYGYFTSTPIPRAIVIFYHKNLHKHRCFAGT